jgi:general secretion pathway protein C
MSAKLFAFVIWAAVAASVVAWITRLAASPQPVPTFAVPVAQSGAARGDSSRLLGREELRPANASAAPSAEAPASSRYRLLGVVAPREGSSSGAAVALIAIEGKPARPLRVGARVDDDLVLLSVDRRGAGLGPSGGEPTVKLELPERPPPATGVPAPTLGLASPAAQPVVVPPMPPSVPPAAEPVAPQAVPGVPQRALGAPGTTPGVAPAQPGAVGAVQ